MKNMMASANQFVVQKLLMKKFEIDLIKYNEETRQVATGKSNPGNC